MVFTLVAVSLYDKGRPFLVRIGKSSASYFATLDPS